MDVVTAKDRPEGAQPAHAEGEEAKALVHVGFEVGLLVKAMHGLVQVAGGFLMLLLTPDRFSALTRFVTAHGLLQDPRDVVADLLLKLSDSFSLAAHHFVLFYLFSHGLVRCVLVFLLWRKKLWAYPLSVGCLLFFIACQLYRYAMTGSLLLFAFTLFDTVMAILTWLEYKNLRPVGA